MDEEEQLRFAKNARRVERLAEQRAAAKRRARTKLATKPGLGGNPNLPQATFISSDERERIEQIALDKLASKKRAQASSQPNSASALGPSVHHRQTNSHIHRGQYTSGHVDHGTSNSWQGPDAYRHQSRPGYDTRISDRRFDGHRAPGRHDSRDSGRYDDHQHGRHSHHEDHDRRWGSHDARRQEDRGGGAHPHQHNRERSPPRSHNRRDMAPPEPTAAQPVDMFATERSRQAEIEAVKARYLGHKVQAKAPRKNVKKRKADDPQWDPKDDTADTTNPLHTQRMAPSLLFGRGTVAGVDERYQRQRGTLLHVLAQRRQAEAEQLAAEAAEIADQAHHAAASMATRAKDGHAAANAREDSELHWSEKPLESMGSRDWRIMREDFDIRVKGGRTLNPLRTWEEGHLHPLVQRAIDDLGYKMPSPIQRQAVPVGLQFRDIIGIAETGSGKTAAFIIPALAYIMSLPQEARDRTPTHGPHCLVMAPSRELAQQIEVEATKLAKFTGVRSVSVVGGLNIEEQGLKIRQGCDLIIGTPGRLIDAVEQKYLALAQCKYIVLDEADRMIDMGFEPQVKAIMNAMQGGESQGSSSAVIAAAAEDRRDPNAVKGHKASDRVTIMFSATMPPEVHALAKAYMKQPLTIEIGDRDSGKNKRIKQTAVYCTESNKARRLTQLLPSIGLPAIVFVNAKAQTEAVSKVCNQAGFPSVVLHGAKAQAQREEALHLFRSGAVPILVATGVAERGLDIPDVAHVVNYDMAPDIDKYTHRVGRTGRAGKKGEATTFFTDGDKRVLADLRKYLENTGNAVPSELARHAAGSSAGDRAIDR